MQVVLLVFLDQVLAVEEHVQAAVPPISLRGNFLPHNAPRVKIVEQIMQAALLLLRTGCTTRERSGAAPESGPPHTSPIREVDGLLL